MGSRVSPIQRTVRHDLCPARHFPYCQLSPCKRRMETDSLIALVSIYNHLIAEPACNVTSELGLSHSPRDGRHRRNGNIHMSTTKSTAVAQKSGMGEATPATAVTENANTRHPRVLVGHQPVPRATAHFPFTGLRFETTASVPRSPVWQNAIELAGRANHDSGKKDPANSKYHLTLTRQMS
jgi:hypothetical protein